MSRKDVSIFIDIVKGANFAAGLKAVDTAVDTVEKLGDVLKDAAVQSVKLAGDFEQTTNALAVFTGGAASARQELSLIDKIANQTNGLTLESAEQGFQRLRALGFEADNAAKIIKGLGTQRILSGSSTQDINRVIVNLTQLSTSSQYATRDIQQMLHAIPGLRGTFQEAFGTLDTKKLKDLLQENPDKFFSDFAAALGKSKEAQGGLNVALEKNADAFVSLGRAFGEPILDPLTEDIRDFTKFLNDNKKTVEDWGQYVSDTLRGVSDAGRGLRQVDYALGLTDDQSKGLKDFADKANPILRRTALGLATFGNSEYFNLLSSSGKESRLAEQIRESKTAPIVGLGNVKRIVKKDGTVDLSSFLGANNTLQFESDNEKKARLGKDDSEAAEENKKALLEKFKSLKSEQLSISENFYKIEESRLKSHLDYTTAQELNTAKTVGANRRSSIESQIILTKAYYADLFRFGGLDKDETIKATREKNAALAKLNGELKVNEFDTQREIQQLENKIRNERRQAAIESKNLEIKDFSQRLETAKSYFLENESNYAKLIELTNDAYIKISKATRESFDEQLKNESLTKEQTVNLNKQKYLELENLAFQNSQNLTRIEQERHTRFIELFKQESEQRIKLTQSRGQLFGSLGENFFKDSINFGGGFSTFGIRALTDNGDKQTAVDLNLKLNNVLEGRTSIYSFQNSLLDKNQTIETTNLQRQIDLNNDLIDLERIKLKGQIQSNIVTLESNRASLLNQSERARSENPDLAQSLTDKANNLGEAIKNWQNTLAQPDLNKYLDQNSSAIKTYNNEVQNLSQSLNNLGITQAAAKQDLFAQSAEGLKRLYEEINSGQKDAIIKDVQERALWQERISLISENKTLELGNYKDSILWAERRRNALLNYDREIYEARQNSLINIEILEKKISDKRVFNQVEAHEKILSHLEQATKSTTDIVADSFISAFDSAGSSIDKMLDKSGIGKVPILGDIAKAQGKSLLSNLSKNALDKFFPDLSKQLEKTENPALAVAKEGLEVQRQIERNTRGGLTPDSLKVPGQYTNPRSLISQVAGGLFGGANQSNPLIYHAAGSLTPDNISVPSQYTNPRIAGDISGGGLVSRIKGIFGTGEGGLFAPKANLLNGGKMSAGAGIGAGLGSIAMLAGGAIGGRWGNALSLAGTGAQFGSMFGPWGAGIGAAIGGGIGIFQALFHHDDAKKKLKQAVQSAYGISISDDSVLSRLQNIGEQYFGKSGAAQNAAQVVQLEESRMIIEAYAQRSGQNTGKLNARNIGDENWIGNQFGGQFSGFPQAAGQTTVAAIIRQSRPQLTAPLGMSSAEMASAVSSKSAQNGRDQMQFDAISELREMVGVLTERLQGYTSGTIIALGAKENPGAFADAVESEFSNDSRRSEQFFRNTGQVY